MTASLLVLGGVLLSVELVRLFLGIRGEHCASIETDSIATAKWEPRVIAARGVDIPPSHALIARQHSSIADTIIADDDLAAQL
jgi:hypothetical protein